MLSYYYKAIFIVFLALFASISFAEDPPPLSPAEQAALEEHVQKTVEMCLYVTQYGSAAAQAELESQLDGQTCEDLLAASGASE